MAVRSPSQSPAGSPALVPQGQHAGKPSLPMGRPFTLIGSRHRAHLHLLSSSVSKSHAIIVNDNGRHYVRDLASREHVSVNDNQIRESDLRDGDILRIGTFTFEFTGGAPAAAPRPSRRAPDAALEIPGESVPLLFEGRTFVIGRRAACDLVLNDPAVSTIHSVIFQLDGKHFIRDLGSRTGTLVNDQPIHQQELHPHDRIRVGETELHFAHVKSADELTDPEQLGGPESGLSVSEGAIGPAGADDLALTSDATEPIEAALTSDSTSRAEAMPHEITASNGELELEPTPSPAQIAARKALEEVNRRALEEAPIPLAEEEPFAVTAPDDAIPLAPEPAEAAEPRAASHTREPGADANAPAESELALEPANDLAELDLDADPDLTGSGDTRSMPADLAETPRTPVLSSSVIDSPDSGEADLGLDFLPDEPEPQPPVEAAHHPDLAIESQRAPQTEPHDEPEPAVFRFSAPADVFGPDDAEPATLTPGDEALPTREAQIAGSEDATASDLFGDATESAESSVVITTDAQIEPPTDSTTAWNGPAAPIEETPQAERTVDERSPDEAAPIEAASPEPPAIEAPSDNTAVEQQSAIDVPLTESVSTEVTAAEPVAEVAQPEPAPVHEEPLAQGDAEAGLEVARAEEATVPQDAESPPVETAPAEAPHEAAVIAPSAAEAAEPVAGLTDVDLPMGASPSTEAAPSTDTAPPTDAARVETPSTEPALGASEIGAALSAMEAGGAAMEAGGAAVETGLAAAAAYAAARIEPPLPATGKGRAKRGPAAPKKGATGKSTGTRKSTTPAFPKPAAPAKAPRAQKSATTGKQGGRGRKKAASVEMAAESLPVTEVTLPAETATAAESASLAEPAAGVGPVVDNAAIEPAAVSESAPAADRATIEVIASTDPTPQSALDLEAQIGPIDEAGGTPPLAPETASPDSLSDTSFGRSVVEFAGPESGALVEPPPTAITASERAIETPIVESGSDESQTATDQAITIPPVAFELEPGDAMMEMPVEPDVASAAEVVIEPLSAAAAPPVATMESVTDSVEPQAALTGVPNATNHPQLVPEDSQTAPVELEIEPISSREEPAPAASAEPHGASESPAARIALEESPTEFVPEQIETSADSGDLPTTPPVESLPRAPMAEVNPDLMPPAATTDEMVENAVAFLAHEESREATAQELLPIDDLLAPEDEGTIALTSVNEGLESTDAPQPSSQPQTVEPIAMPEQTAHADPPAPIEITLSTPGEASGVQSPAAEVSPVEATATPAIPEPGIAFAVPADVPVSSPAESAVLELEPAPALDEVIHAQEGLDFLSDTPLHDSDVPSDSPVGSGTQDSPVEAMPVSDLDSASASIAPEPLTWGVDTTASAPPPAGPNTLTAPESPIFEPPAQADELPTELPETAPSGSAPPPGMDPFLGMSRDFGSFLGGIPLPLASGAPPRQDAPPVRMRQNPLPLSPAPVVEVKPPEKADEPPELFDAAPETLDALPDSLDNISDLTDVLAGPSAPPPAPQPPPTAQRPSVTIRQRGAVSPAPPPQPKVPSPVQSGPVIPEMRAGRAPGKPGAPPPPVGAPVSSRGAAGGPRQQPRRPGQAAPAGRGAFDGLALPVDVFSQMPVGGAIFGAADIPTADVKIPPTTPGSRARGGVAKPSGSAKTPPLAKAPGAKAPAAAKLPVPPKSSGAPKAPATAVALPQSKAPGAKAPVPVEKAAIAQARDPAKASTAATPPAAGKSSAGAKPAIAAIAPAPEPAFAEPPILGGGAFPPAAPHPMSEADSPLVSIPEISDADLDDALSPAAHGPAAPIEEIPEHVLRELHGEEPISDPADSPDVPIDEKRKKKKRKFPFFGLSLLCLCTGGAAVGVWYGLPPRTDVTASVRFDGLDKYAPAAQHQFARRVAQDLNTTDYRQTAQQVYVNAFGGQQGPSVLYGANGAQAVVYDQLLRDADVKGDRFVLQRRNSPDGENDAQRLRALMKALYTLKSGNRDEASRQKNAAETARSSLAQVEQQIVALQQSSVERAKARSDYEVAVMNEKDAVSRAADLEKSWNKARIDVRSLHAELEAIVNGAAASPDQQAAANADPLVKQLTQQWQAAGDSLAQALAEPNGDPESILAPALADVRQQLDNARAASSAAPALAGYIGTVRQALDAMRQIGADATRQNNATRQALGDLYAALAEHVSDNLKSAWAGDLDLQNLKRAWMNQQRDLGAGTGLSGNATQARAQLDRLAGEIDTRRQQIAASLADTDQIKTIRKLISLELDQANRDAAGAQQLLGQQFDLLAAIVPVADSLGPDASAAMDQISHKITDLKVASASATQVMTTGLPGAQTANLAARTAELHARLQARRHQLTSPTASLDENTLASAAQKRTRIEAAAQIAAKALADWSGAVANVATMQSAIDRLQPAQSALIQDNARLVSLRAQRDDLKGQLDRLAAAPVLAPRDPEQDEDAVRIVRHADLRGYLLGGLGVMFVAGIAWLLSHRGRVREVPFDDTDTGSLELDGASAHVADREPITV